MTTTTVPCGQCGSLNRYIRKDGRLGPCKPCHWAYLKKWRSGRVRRPEMHYMGKPCAAGHAGMRYDVNDSCVECNRLSLAARHRRLRGTPDYQDRQRIKQITKYGITLDEYHAMFESQNEQCALCYAYLDRPHVDHAHGGIGIRGLLCFNCNGGLGQFK